MPVRLAFLKYVALFYAILIFAVSAIPNITLPSLGLTFEDKILHFIEYSIFSFFLFLAFFTSRRKFLREKVLLFSSLIGIAYALSDEIHQKFVPGRHCDVFDFLADCLGIMVIQIAVWFYLRRKRRREGRSPIREQV
ncbi:MAG: VanZ family protein [Candidatus Zixiibacteriota bacterium]